MPDEPLPQSTADIGRGRLVALVAAALFGLTTPLVRHFGVSVGPFATAALLYVGSAVGSGVHRRGAGEPSPGAAQQLRVLVAAVLGATLAPASLAWGLQHAGALAASLLLNLEALFTVLLARALYREPLGSARFAGALALMLVGGALLALRAAGGGASTFLGLTAVLGASLGWALDSSISRPLADFDARTVVFSKSIAGAALSVGLAFVMRDTWPSRDAAFALVACGIVGYGLSLRFYLRAQRALGAARTATLFALAPFVGAAAAFAAGDREGAGLVAAAGAVFATAAYLQTTEDHRHWHRHEALEHEHPHRHDDGHHTHTHERPVAGEHSHVHQHEATEHEHSHASDIHHGHGHDPR